MRPRFYQFTPAAANTSGFASGITGAGPWTMTTTTPGDSLAHLVTINSTANLSTITFTIYGTNPDGEAQTEDITGPNATTVTGTRYFASVTSVSASATLGGSTANIGWAAASVSRTMPVRWRKLPFGVSVGVTLTGTINVTLQYTLEDVRSVSYTDRRWFAFSGMSGITASTAGGHLTPVVGARLLVNSVTSGATARVNILS